MNNQKKIMKKKQKNNSTNINPVFNNIVKIMTALSFITILIFGTKLFLQKCVAYSNKIASLHHA